MNSPIISVIIPLYNKENTIKYTIESVLNQSFTDFELIIIDDGSTDSSAKIVSLYEDKRIRYMCKENGGVSSARNEGVRIAIGEWILFLDADDILYNQALESLFTPIINCPEVGIVCGQFHFKKGNTYITHLASNFEGIVTNNFKFYFINKIQLRMGNFIIRKSIVQKHYFNENLSRYEDMQSLLDWMRVVKMYAVSKYVMCYNTDASSLSRPSGNMEKDFVWHLDFRRKTFWEKCKLGELMYLGLVNYPNHRCDIVKKYYKYVCFMIIAKLKLLVE